MEELTDFEELIDLSLSLPCASQSSQEPISDVLDKICKVMDESNFAMEIMNDNKNECDEIGPDDNINLDDFEHLIAAASLRKHEGYLMGDDSLEINGTLMIQDAEDDIIDLEEFESISANECLFIDEDTTTNSNISNSHLRNSPRVMSYVPVEFERSCDLKTKCDAIKENTINMEKHAALTIESTAISSEKEINNCIVDTVNPIPKMKSDDKVFDNRLETNNTECKIETNVIEDIVTFLINDKEGNYDNRIETHKGDNDSERKHEFGIETSKPDCENTIETLTEDMNAIIKADSDNDFDEFDFEFITEEEASKAGIYTKVNKTITAPNTFKNANNVNKAQQIKCVAQNSNSTDDRPRNEASISDYVKYSKYRYKRCYSRPASEFHVIPVGEQYLDMFRGEHAPIVLNNLYSLRNKRVLPAVAMAANFEELAKRHPMSADEDNEMYKDDANDCINKILSMYPRENSRKRRRH